MSTVGKKVSLLLPAVILSVLISGQCSRQEAHLLTPQEATTQIAAAFAAKDTECGTTHNITLPIVNSADKEHVASCVAQIVSLTCSAWSANDPTPPLCLVILIDLKNGE